MEPLPIISSLPASPPLPSPRQRLKSRDHVGQDETAKHGRASHYTISRDDTSLGSSSKDKLRALRKARDDEEERETFDFEEFRLEPDSPPPIPRSRSRSHDRSNYAPRTPRHVRHTDALHSQNHMPESQSDFFVQTCEKGSRHFK